MTVDECPIRITASAVRGEPARVLAVAMNGKGEVGRDTLDPNSATARKRFIGATLQKAFQGAAPDDYPDGIRDALDEQLLAIARVPPGDGATGGGPANHDDGRPADGGLAAAAEKALAATPADIRAAAEGLLADPALMWCVADDLTACGLAGEEETKCTLYLVGTSRKLAKPVNARVHGASSAGKSYTIGTVADLMPPEAVIRATRISPAALYHMDPGALVHRFVVAGERSLVEKDEAAEATRALREMMSDGKLSLLVTVKGDDGKFKTELVERQGPIAFVESTTLATVFNEDANRCIQLHADERAEQTGKVKAQLAAHAEGAGDDAGRARVVAVHQCLQRLLQPYDVVVPFAGRLAELTPNEPIEMRRAFGHVLMLVKACALLHQRQRRTDGAGRLVADLHDYEIVRYLIGKPLGQALKDGPSDAVLKFYDLLAKTWPHVPRSDPSKPDLTPTFSTTEARRLKGAPGKRSVHYRLKELYEAGALELVEDQKGNRPAIWRLTARKPETAPNILPAVDKLTGAADAEGPANAEEV